MANVNRQIIKRGLSVWTKLSSTVVWFEAGKKWANGLIRGSALERNIKKAALNLMAPGFGQGLNYVLEHYRGKLKKYIGPNGIWIAVKIRVTSSKSPRVYAKKRTNANKLKTPSPWEPKKWNVS